MTDEDARKKAQQLRHAAEHEEEVTGKKSTSWHRDLKVITDLLKEKAALQQRVRELEEALQPFVRSCAWVEADDYPIRISNDHTASGFDLLPDEVERARKAWSKSL